MSFTSVWDDYEKNRLETLLPSAAYNDALD